MRIRKTYPDPDNADPTTRDSPDVSEAPVTVSGDDGGHKLGQAEGEEKSRGGTLHEEESMRTSNEDQGLRYDGDLKVDDHVQLRIVRLHGGGLEGNAELVLEECGLHNDDDKGNPIGRQ